MLKLAVESESFVDVNYVAIFEPGNTHDSRFRVVIDVGGGDDFYASLSVDDNWMRGDNFIESTHYKMILGVYHG